MTNDTTDQRAQEWRTGLRIALVAAEDIGLQMWCNGRIDVRNGAGKVIFSSPFWKLPRLAREVAEREEAQP